MKGVSASDASRTNILCDGASMLNAAEPIDADVLRIRHEYLSRPDLRLSSRTAALMFDISSRHADRLLELLVRERFLLKESNGEYRRAIARQQSASA